MNGVGDLDLTAHGISNALGAFDVSRAGNLRRGESGVDAVLLPLRHGVAIDRCVFFRLTRASADETKSEQQRVSANSHGCSSQEEFRLRHRGVLKIAPASSRGSEPSAALAGDDRPGCKRPSRPGDGGRATGRHATRSGAWSGTAAPRRPARPRWPSPPPPARSARDAARRQPS